MKKIIKKILIFSSIVSLVAVFTGCHRHKWNPEKRMEHAAEKISSKLDLNDQQEKQLKQLFAVISDQRKEFKQSGEITTLLNQIKGESLDENVVTDTLTTRVKKMEERIPEIVKHLKTLHASLNKEQREELNELIEYFEKKMNR